jgi:hypothetical protein
LIRHAPSILSSGTGKACRLLLAMLPGGALAQAAATETPGVSASTLLQTVLGLAVVIGILLLAAYLLRKAQWWSWLSAATAPCASWVA